MSFNFENVKKITKQEVTNESSVGDFNFNNVKKLKKQEANNNFTATTLLNNPTNNLSTTDKTYVDSILNDKDMTFLKSSAYYAKKYEISPTEANVLAQVKADGYNSFEEANQKNALLISKEAERQNYWENLWDEQWAKTKKRWKAAPEFLTSIFLFNKDAATYSLRQAPMPIGGVAPPLDNVGTDKNIPDARKINDFEYNKYIEAIDKNIDKIQTYDWFEDLRIIGDIYSAEAQIYTQALKGEGSQSVRKSWQEGNYKQAFKDIATTAAISAPDFLATIALAIANPVLGFSYLGSTVGTDRYQQGISDGENPKEASGNAMLYIAAELILERMGALGMVNDFMRGQKGELIESFAKKIMKHLREPTSEGLTQIAQNAIDGNPLSEGLEEALAVGFLMGETVNAVGFAKNKLTKGDFNRIQRQTKEQIQKNIDENDIIKNDPEGQRLYQAAIDNNSDENVKAWNNYLDNKLDKLIEQSIEAGEGKTLTEQEIKDIRETSIFDDIIQPIADKNNVSLEVAKDIYISSVQAQDIDVDVQVDNAKKAIANIAPDVEVIVHDTNEAYVEATGSTATGGIYDPTAKVVHINKNKPNQRTVSHEVFHAILLSKVKNDGQAQQLADELFKRVYRNSTGVLRAELDNHTKQYGQDLKSEEALAELASIISTNYNVIDASGRTAIRKLIDFIGKGLQNLGFNVVTDKDVIDLMNTVGGKIARGEAIEQADIAVLDIVEKGKIENIDNAKVREQKINKEDIKKIPKHKNAIIKDNFKVKLLKNKMTSVTHSDRMLAGRYGDTDFFGGILYPMVTGRIWAFDSLGTANGFVDSLVQDKDGYYYFIPAIMSDTSHLSNRNMTTIIFNLFEDAVKTKTLDPVDVRKVLNKTLNIKQVNKYGEVTLDLQQYKDTVLQAFDNATTPEGKIVALKDSVLNQVKTFNERKSFIVSLLGKAEKQTQDNFFNSVGTANTIGRLFAEPLAEKAGIREAPVVIRFKDKPKVVKTVKGQKFHHDSYSYSVQLPKGKKVETLILSDVIDVVQAIPEFTNKDGVVSNKKERIEGYLNENKSLTEALAYIFRDMGMASFSAPMTGELGQPNVRTMKGTRIKRHINENGEAVGKRMGDFIFVHRLYETDVVPKDILENAKKQLPEDFLKSTSIYQTIRYNRKTGAVRFDKSINFRTANEPTAGNYIEVSTDGTTRKGKTDSVFHHKWLWVKNSYTGFNVANSVRRSQEWTERIAQPSGSPAVWKTQLEEAGLSKRERKDLSTQYSNKLGKDVLKRSGDTQVGNTVSTVKKIKQYIVENFTDGNTLDYGAGLGKGAEAINADSLEVNPEEGFNPTYTDSRDIPSNSYDNIISTSVLNVVPPDIRDYIVEQVARILRPNGVAVFTARAKITAEQKTPQFDIEPDAYLVKGKKGLQYQKAFASGELETYIQNLLGKGFIVSKVPNISGRVVSVQKIDNTDFQNRERRVNAVRYERLIQSIINRPVTEAEKKKYGVRTLLKKDLIKDEEKDNPMFGHCYVATETLYYLIGGKNQPFQPCRGRDGTGYNHWWLQHKKTGEIIDVTADQYRKRGEFPPYENGKFGGFLTNKPSKRTKIVLDRLSKISKQNQRLVNIDSSQMQRNIDEFIVNIQLLDGTKKDDYVIESSGNTITLKFDDGTTTQASFNKNVPQQFGTFLEVIGVKSEVKGKGRGELLFKEITDIADKTDTELRVLASNQVDPTGFYLKQGFLKIQDGFTNMRYLPEGMETRERKAPEGEISQEDIDAATQEIKNIDEATREERRAIRVKEVVGFDTESANDIRDALDMLELDEPTRRSLLDVLDNVKEEKFDDQADALAEEVLNKPRPISDKEVAGLALKITKLYSQLKTAINKRNEAMNDGNEQLVNELQSEIGRLYKNMDKLQVAMKTGATETARGLRAMAIKITEDKYDLINVRNQARTAKGNPLNEAENKILEEGVKDIEKKRIRFENKEQKIKRLLRQLEDVRKMHREKYRKIKRGQPLETKEETDIKEQIKLIRAKMRLEDATATVEEDLRLLKEGRLDEMSINQKKNQPKEIKELEKEREALYQAKAKLHKAIYKMRGFRYNLPVKIINVMRAFRLWGDSWLGRQGIKRLLSNPIQTLGVFFQSFPSTFSDMRFLNLMEKMKKDRDYERMEEVGVYFMDIDQTFEQQQEGFGSNWADKIPWIRASNRNMVGGLNMLRYTMMKDFMVKNPDASQEVLIVYAKHVNEATGRGNSKTLNKIGSKISNFLLAPRFVLSQIQTLFDVKNMYAPDPVTGKINYLKPNKTLMKEIGGQWARTWISMYGIVQSMALLGWELERDPEESDFLKFRKDDVVIDFMFGGKASILKLIFYIGEIALATRGIGELEGREQLRQSFLNWASYKGNTWISTAHELVTGKNIIGQEKHLLETIGGAMFPIIIETVYTDIRNGEEGFNAVRDAMPELFGFNTSKYEDKSAIKIRY